MDLDYAAEVDNFPTWVIEANRKIVGGLTMIFADDRASDQSPPLAPSALDKADHPFFSGSGDFRLVMRLGFRRSATINCQPGKIKPLRIC
jgi:hypothetical protein